MTSLFGQMRTQKMSQCLQGAVVGHDLSSEPNEDAAHGARGDGLKTQMTPGNGFILNLLSMELTYFSSGLLFAAVVKRWVWDYAFTVTLIHIALTSVVMLEFPLVWQWWLALGSGLFLMICNGQLIAYFACQNDHWYPAFHSY
ncbi:TM244 protein, partial [Atractosteus spatula]|nr:TM244 protein [Atractosteus spatula]